MGDESWSRNSDALGRELGKRHWPTDAALSLRQLTGSGGPFPHPSPHVWLKVFRFHPIHGVFRPILHFAGDEPGLSD